MKSGTADHRFLLIIVTAVSIPVFVQPCRAEDNRTGRGPIIGMYIHQHWPFNRPYAARTWTLEDWTGYVDGLHRIGYNTIQIWPVLETMPEPLTDSDRANLAKIARVIDIAHDMDMRVYVVICANIVADDAKARQATFETRHFFHCDLRVDPADRGAVERMMQRRRRLFEPLSRCDGVTIIDSDPGGYPGSTNEEFVYLLGEHRKMLDSLRGGIELIYWLHVSWPAYSRYYATGRFAWGTVAEFEDALVRLKGLNPEPWGYANGLQLAAKLGISESRVINFRYGVIEAEPSYPLTNFGGTAAYEAGMGSAPKGVMGNAQAHCLQLPNTFAFARGAQGLPVERGDYVAFAEGLIIGKGEQIVGAWEALSGPDAGLMQETAGQVEQWAGSELRPGKLSGLLFGEPDRFVLDLAIQLRFKAAYRDMVMAFEKGQPLKEPLGAFLDALETWQERHGYENYWGFASFGAWPDLMKILDKINQPAVEAVRDFDLQAKTPFGRICEEFYRMETFTPQLIAAMRQAQRDME